MRQEGSSLLRPKGHHVVISMPSPNFFFLIPRFFVFCFLSFLVPVGHRAFEKGDPGVCSRSC